MADRFDNFVASAWLAGERTIENYSPSDASDLMGRYACGQPD